MFFQPIAVRSIHRKRMPVSEIKSGQTASFALKKIKRSQIRKGGFVVLGYKLNSSFDLVPLVWKNHPFIPQLIPSIQMTRNGDGFPEAEPAVLLGV